MTVHEWLRLPLPELAVVDRDVCLRPWEVADVPVLAAGWADPEVNRWLATPDATVDAAAWIGGVDDRRAAGLAIDAAVVVDGAVVGEIGLHAFDRRRRAALIGYWIGAGHRGRGLAVAAVATTARWWFDTIGGQALLARCAAANVASWRTAERAGFTVIDEREGERILALRRSPGRGRSGSAIEGA